jgi:adenosyl cobinamide kinase/adenosyl cobinamide phosphate guanylyltransferase
VNVVWPLSLSPSEKSRIAAEVRADTLAGCKMIHEEFGLDFREAKALSLHITDRAGACNRCHHALHDEVALCEQCRAANLDW